MLLDRLFRREDREPLRLPAASDLALANTRDLCAVVGPWQIAADYGAMPEASLPEIAGTFARKAFPGGDLSIHAAACAGALAGFQHYLATHPEDPYD